MTNPHPVVPALFPLSLFEEGWAGVAAFMTLSGYLCAKIYNEWQIRYGAFLWNRFIRLAPLLFLMIMYYATFKGGYSWDLFFAGFYRWAWPGTSWAVAVEMHFYLVFPLLLLLQRRFGITALLLTLAGTVGLRTCLWLINGEVQSLAYWSIVGHFDQFLLGMVFSQTSNMPIFKQRANAILVATALGLMLFWHAFNLGGGFFALGGVYPSPSPLWIVLPTIEGAFWGCLIASYENAKISIPRFIDRLLARIGEVSYSIYLLQDIFLSLSFVRVINYSINTMITGASAVLLFIPMVGISIIAFELIERPFLRFRTRYRQLSNQ